MRGYTWATIARGLRLSPELRVGLGVTVLLALVAAGGRVIVPITLQEVVDRGLVGEQVNLGVVGWLSSAALAAVLVTAAASAVMNARLARVTETALASLRVRAFRHLHDLSALALAAEQRGVLVARVTDDIDTISRFMQWGGIMLLVSTAQLVLATTVMAVLSWQLTLVVLGTFVPLVVTLRWFSGRLQSAYADVRVRVGAMLGVLAESVVGTDVIRAHAIQERTRGRIVAAIEEHRRASFKAARTGAFMYASGEVVAALATAGAVVLGVALGLGGDLTVGELLAFLFLATLFVAPVQVMTEVLDQAQTAIAGWGRVLDLLERIPDVRDPHPRAVDLPPGPVAVSFDHVSFSYPPRDGAQAPVVLKDIDLEIAPRTRVAVVGETGSGKSTFAALLTRLVDPSSGRVCLNGVDVREVRFASLRRTVLLVPQDGFLFDTTIERNVSYGRPGLGPDEIAEAFARLGLADWLAGLPKGLGTSVGERGGELSVGERQLVSLARAFVANPELLVLDEATSAVDPATEARLQRALDRLTTGRTSVTIAHRLSTAIAAHEILVFDGGRIVERGPHERLVSAGGVYARLHASWVASPLRAAG